MEQVTPDYEFCPERSYIRVGAKIMCFDIISDSGGVLNRVIVLSESPVFTLVLHSEAAAKALMKDLYYGEYAGA